MLYFVGPGAVTLGFALVCLSYCAFSTGENILASFLPDICPPSSMGRISGIGCMVSHLGGLTVLGLCLAYVEHCKALHQTAAQYVPILVLIVAVNYALFALPSFFFLKEHGHARKLPDNTNIWKYGFSRVLSTAKQSQHFQDLIRLLITILLYTCGTSTIVVLSAVYAREVMNFSMSDNIAMFMLINLTATAGAYLYGFIQDKIGSKGTLILALSNWLLAVLVLAFSADRLWFWIAAGLLGNANGGTFAVGRASVGRFAPHGRAGEFFGLWGLSCKFAAIVGPISYGLIAYLSNGNHRLAILSCAMFFLASLIIATSINDQRGIEAARSAES
jgi:UMF1 family MFS transporter